MLKRRIFYGWFVLASAVAIVSVAYSMRYSFSVFYKAILDEFGWSRAETAAALSVNMLVYGLSSPFVGSFVDRYGPKRILLFGATLLGAGLLGISQMNSIWLFYILFGVVMAVGINSLGYAVHNSYIPNWFQKRLGLAFGILIMSSGAATVIASQYQRLILLLSWRMTYRLMAVFVLGIIVPLAIFLIRRTPDDMGLTPDGAEKPRLKEGVSTNSGRRIKSVVVDREWSGRDWTLGTVFRVRRFWLIFLAQVFVSITLNTITAHQVIYYQDIGFDPVFAASILGFVGVITMAGNLMSSISDRYGREVTFTIGAAGTVIAISALMQASYTRPWLLYAFAITWGIFFGIGSPSLTSGLADMFSGRHFGSVNGLYLMGWGFGGAIGPWLGGYVYDTSGSYRVAFLILVACMALATGLFWLAAPRKVRCVPGQAGKIVRHSPSK